MASPQTQQQHLRAILRVQSYKLSGTAGAILAFGAAWRSLFDVRRVLVNFNSIVIGAAITKVEIIADDTSDGSSGSLIVVKDSGTIAADAVDDQANLEMTDREVMEVGVKDHTLSTPADRATTRMLDYYNVRVTTTDNADVGNVCVIEEMMHQKDDNTPETSIA